MGLMVVCIAFSDLGNVLLLLILCQDKHMRMVISEVVCVLLA